MRTIFDAVKNGECIVIKSPRGGRRIAAELFPLKDGAVFFDIFWYGSSGHPMHRIPGPMFEGTDYWEFGDFEKDGDWTGWVFDPKHDMDLQGDKDSWEAYKKTDEGKNEATTEFAYSFVEEMLEDMNKKP